MDFIRLMRPHHWIKNAFVFAALLFGKKLVGSPDEVLVAIGSSLGAFFCFCLASSAIYIFNDIIDRKADQLHPEKRYRPIASGKISIASAAILGIICMAISLVCSYLLANTLAIIIAIYLLLFIAYSVSLKNIMVIDCIAISIGFCLRAIAGTIVVGVSISPWLIICTFALCLFFGFGKRRSELASLGSAIGYRKTLSGYNPEILSHMLDVSSCLAIVCFLLYAMDDRTIILFGTNNLVYTTPFVIYSIFRFSILIRTGRYTGPVQIILRDIPFIISGICWGICCILIINYSQNTFSFWNY